jgi:hypothetical protein
MTASFCISTAFKINHKSYEQALFDEGSPREIIVVAIEVNESLRQGTWVEALQPYNLFVVLMLSCVSPIFEIIG